MTDKESQAARREAAAGWYAELQDEQLAADVWQRFLAWERDPANAAAFREIEATLAVLDRTGQAARTGRRKRAPARLWTGAALAAAIFAGAVLFLFVPGPSPGPAVSAEIYATATGEQREVQLADGSTLTLNTGTRLDVHLSSHARTVRLSEGQALFEVARGDAPFTVEAAGVRTTALGTVFDVWAKPGGLAVTLVEGAVEVKEDGDISGHTLRPGQQLQVSGGEARILEVDPAMITGWQSGMIPFRDVTLAEAIAELNRYSDIRLVIIDPSLAEERLSGVFPAGEQEVFVESLRLFLPVEADRSGNEILIRRAN